MNCLIILGGGLDKDEQLNVQTRLRYDKALEIEDNFDHIICSAGFTYHKEGRERKHSEAEIGRRYLLSRGVAGKKILLEDKSKDTFSNAFYCRRIIERLKIKEFTVVISDDEIIFGDWFLHTVESIVLIFDRESSIAIPRECRKKVIATIYPYKLKGLPMLELPTKKQKQKNVIRTLRMPDSEVKKIVNALTYLAQKKTDQLNKLQKTDLLDKTNQDLYKQIDERIATYETLANDIGCGGYDI